ncbi:MAG: right-handed parallel beta-helix repeat-containing protein [Deltaproteobacteria bacterium]|jgi:hypothetical protein|nr:right-handed parallel beta-helix repeat-containing protein [Deltaproteobacteria bacterium]MBW2530139.1 right-handed parallel beta-helix repeat-containing protein [Deltaproteobacteria bacterium]
MKSDDARFEAGGGTLVSRRQFVLGAAVVTAAAVGCGDDSAADPAAGGAGGQGAGGGAGAGGAPPLLDGVRIVSVEPTADGATLLWETAEGTGTYHLLIAKQQTARAEAVVRSGDLTGEVTEAGQQEIAISGLASERDYQLHLVQVDAGGARSEVASAELTTLARATTGTTYRSGTDLGWAAGENVGDQLREWLAQTAQPGDELVLEATYLLSGGVAVLPADFVLSAVAGAGFESVDPSSQGRMLELGDRCILRNVSVTHPAAPNTGTTAINPVAGTDYYQMAAVAIAGHDVLLERCRFANHIGQHVLVDQVRRLEMRNCHIEGGFWAVTVTGHDHLFYECLFERSLGDGIKTLRGEAMGVQRPLVQRCVYQHNNRDGIDTTGGFQDGVIEDTIFRNIQVGGCDFKTIVEGPADLSIDLTNTNIRLERCDVSDCTNFVVCSLVDRANLVDGESAPTWAPHDFFLIDCIVERNEGAGEARVVLFKGAHSLTYDDLQLLGDVNVYKASSPYDTFGLGTPEASAALNYGVDGTSTEGAPRGPSTAVPFAFGPA